MEHDTASMTRIYQQWHDHARNRDTAALIGLYAEDAVFESPLVPVIMHTDSGMLRGRERILAFLEEGTRRRPNELVRWYRTGQYLVAGDTLVWEYPRQTPDGDQIDILDLPSPHLLGLVRHPDAAGFRYGQSVWPGLTGAVMSGSGGTCRRDGRFSQCHLACPGLPHALK